MGKHIKGGGAKGWGMEKKFFEKSVYNNLQAVYNMSRFFFPGCR